jgi:hypothetical protein
MDDKKAAFVSTTSNSAVASLAQGSQPALNSIHNNGTNNNITGNNLNPSLFLGIKNMLKNHMSGNQSLTPLQNNNNTIQSSGMASKQDSPLAGTGIAGAGSGLPGTPAKMINSGGSNAK